MSFRPESISFIEFFDSSNKEKTELTTKSSVLDVTTVPYQREICWGSSNVRGIFYQILDLARENQERVSPRDKTMAKLLTIDRRAHDKGTSQSIGCFDGQQRSNWFTLLFKGLIVHINKNFSNSQKCKEIRDKLESCICATRGGLCFPKVKLVGYTNDFDDLIHIIIDADKERASYLNQNKGFKEHRVCELYNATYRLIKDNLRTEEDLIAFYELGLLHFKAGIRYIDNDEERNEVFQETNVDLGVDLTETQLFHDKISVEVNQSISDSDSILESSLKTTLGTDLRTIKQHPNIECTEILYYMDQTKTDRGKTVLPMRLTKKDRKRLIDDYCKFLSKGTIEENLKLNLAQLRNAIIKIDNFNRGKTSMVLFDKLLPLCPNITERDTNLIVYKELFERRSKVISSAWKEKIINTIYSIKCISRIMGLKLTVGRFNEKLFEFFRNTPLTTEGEDFYDEFIIWLSELDELRSIMEVTEDTFIDKLVKYKFNLNNSIERALIRTLLSRANYMMSEKKEIVDWINNESITVEHIISQEDNGTSLPDNLLQTLGNFTFLESTINSSAGKLPYDRKLQDHYTKSSIYMTKNLTLADNPSDSEKNKVRGEKLAKLIWKSFNR